MKKHIDRATDVKSVNWESVRQQTREQEIVIAVNAPEPAIPTPNAML